jgi:hypothetical protein
MKHSSLRKTPSHLHLTYKYGEPSGGLLGRNMTLDIDGSLLVLEIDLESNLRRRDKSSSWFQDASALLRQPHKLKSLQCPDNLVRARLIRAWEQVERPRLRMRLAFGEGERLTYDVAPHSLFTGGIQFDVQALVEHESDEHAAQPVTPGAGHNHFHRNHA